MFRLKTVQHHPKPLNTHCHVVNDAILYLPLSIIGYLLTKSGVKGGKLCVTQNPRIHILYFCTLLILPTNFLALHL